MDSAQKTTVLWLSLLVALVDAQNTQPVQISVFYETLCGDSRHFIVDELKPAWDKFGSALDIQFIPFGKAHSNSDGSFVCQHGPNECRGNLIDSCVLSKLPKGGAQVKYVADRMEQPSSSDDEVQKHAEEAGVSWSDVISCTNAVVGRNLQLEAERETKTRTPGPKFVPTVIFNNVYNQQLQTEIQRGGFDRILCQNFMLC
ncbi:gamma-interferon-inducible lysosomal thiol reductase-like [Lycorma delicatula]|uniref:gamma-interferon-inducible lysosomal thiol reductase-like n=1 Tax=Lycorma delicatula TaxID=130591 RepID=UPI003F511CA4